VINIVCGYNHIFNHKAKSCYDGAVTEEGKRHGFGTETFPNGYWRQGKYVNDEFRSGRGKMMVGDEVKEGIWSEGKFFGTFEGKWNMYEPAFRGTIHFVSGDTYEGGLLQDKHDVFRHGFGVQRDANGYVYEGELDHGTYHGQGRITFANGDTFVGEFVHGACEVRGTITYRDGRIAQGTFKKNQLVQGKRTYVNGDVYEGAFMSNSEPQSAAPRHGFGTLIEKSGARYEGLHIRTASRGAQVYVVICFAGDMR
jgi:hypothetical protein